jgi:hypothetical protein
MQQSDPNSQVVDVVTDLGGKVYNTGKNIAASQVNKAINYLIPNLDSMSDEEAKRALISKAAKLNAVLQDLAFDPEVQQLISQTGEAFAKLTSELMDAIEEPVEELSDRSIDLLGKLATNSGRTLTKTGVDLVMSILGEIPGVGGLVDLGVTSLVAFNGLAKNIQIGSDNLVKMATIANKLTDNALAPIEESLDVFSNLKSRAAGVYQNIDNRLEQLNQTYKHYDGRIKQAQAHAQSLLALPSSSPADTRAKQPITLNITPSEEKKERPRNRRERSMSPEPPDLDTLFPKK